MPDRLPLRCLLVVPLLAVCACATEDRFAPPDPSLIDRAEMERVLGTLAADDIRGRRAFSVDAERAAEFLAREFAAAGIGSAPDAEGHLQRFNVRSITPDQVSVTIDGAPIEAPRVGSRLSSESLSWSTGDASVIVVGPDAEVRSAVFAGFRGSGNTLMLVNEAHAQFFNQIANGFLSGANRTLEPGGSNLIMVLSNAGAAAAYSVEASATAAEETLVNVVGVIPGRRTDEIVLFSAHYDHIGIRPPVDGDSIANGANDDASGTAAVVALARYYAQRGTPERTIMFAAFTAEEGSGFGSQHFSRQLNPDHVVAMFNIEMIGKPAVEGPNTAWITGFDRSSFGSILQDAVDGTEYEFYADPYPDQNLFYRSDNATLARLGVPAHSISTTPIDVDADYHQVSDEISTLDLNHVTNTIRAIAMGAESIVTGTDTPTRVDPATVN